MPMPISHNAFDILQTDIAHSSRFRRTWKMRFLLKSTAGQLSWNQLISPLCTKHLGCTDVTSNSIVRHPYLSRSLIGRVKCPKANKQFLCVQYTILGNIHFLEWVGGWHKSHKTLKAMQPSYWHLVDVIFTKNNFGWLGFHHFVSTPCLQLETRKWSSVIFDKSGRTWSAPPYHYNPWVWHIRIISVTFGEA